MFENELANKIIDGMDKLYSKYDDSMRRWVWELIQNAQDASIGSKPVNIEIIIT